MKSECFTQVGRIHKNENWQDELLSITGAELGLNGIAVEGYALMGSVDYFYKNRALHQNTPTHYLDLLHHAEFTSKLEITLDHYCGEFE